MLSFPDAAGVLGVALQLPDPSRLIQGASIDTRTLKSGNLFIAFRGAQVDGHDFLAQAFAKGASGAIVEQTSFLANAARFSDPSFHNILPVPDPAAALVQLASAYRDRFPVQAVGITGSVGKTSTKEFLAWLLGQKKSILATAGNFNNHLGLPLTLFNLRQEHEVCVTELGANHKGEIKFLCGILKPHTAILTMIAPVHVEGFGSLEGIYEAKSELMEALKPGAYVVLPDDDPVLTHRAERLKLKPVLAGDSWRAHYRYQDIKVENGYVTFTVNKKHTFSFPGSGTFLVRNAVMALAMAEICGVKMQDLPAVWDSFKLPSGRFEEHLLNGITFIFDGYNANPKAFEAALESFSRLKSSGRKWVVFSDMGELGPEEKQYHRLLGEQIAALGFPCAAYGALSSEAVEAARARGGAAEHFKDAAGAASYLEANLRAGDAVLLKASRSMKIETILNHFKSRPNETVPK